MTSTIPPGFAQHDLEGRSVRDVVEHSPGEVDDAWCHKVLRKILKSLELQYAMQMPHRAITPDTVVFHANGEPLLISDDIDAAPAPDAHQADDLTALARVIHYAITHEREPAGPLSGRVDGYSAAVVATIDACMDPDPALRPRSVDTVRGLLATVTQGSATPTVLAPSARERDAAVVAAGTHPAAMRRGSRRAIAVGGGAIAIALALVAYVELRNAGPNERIAPTLPQTGDVVPQVAAPVAAVAVDARTEQVATGTAKKVDGDLAATPASDRTGSTGASSGGTTHSGGGADQRDGMTRVPSGPASAAAPVDDEAVAARADTPRAAAPANASYQLHIKPWGVVYVDGVERGVSPPVKRLALTPGPHTIRITNPKYRDSVLEFESAQTTSNGKIIVDFTEEAQ